MKHITLRNIEIHNFRKIDELTVNFDGLQLITGPNGSGKSSIFEAIYTALYNRRPNGQSSKTAIKKGASSTYLKLEFEVNDDVYVLERKISNSKSYVNLTYNGVQYSNQGNTIKQVIEGLIPS
jgi:exonuclease SbcC